MEKVLKIGEKEVKMTSSSKVLVTYESNFNGDILSELIEMKDKKLKPNSLIKLAWCMAKDGDEANTPPYEKWLEEFDVMDLMQSLPEIMELITNNFKQNDDKKK